MRTVKTSTKPSYPQCITLNLDRVALLEPTSQGFFRTFFGEEIITGLGWTYPSVCFSCLQILDGFWVEWSFGGPSVVQVLKKIASPWGLRIPTGQNPKYRRFAFVVLWTVSPGLDPRSSGSFILWAWCACSQPGTIGGFERSRSRIRRTYADSLVPPCTDSPR
jgi:hypothetical protein